MGVHAHYPSNGALAEPSRARMWSLVNGLDDKNAIATPVLVHSNTVLDELRMLYGTAAAGASNSFFLSSPCQLASGGAFHTSEDNPESIFWNNNNNYNAANNNNNSRKRLRESPAEVADFAPFGVYQSNGAAVSTGLRLNFEDDLLNGPPVQPIGSTDLTADNNNNNNNPHHDSISAVNFEILDTELQRQRGELDEYMRLQGEHVRQNVEEKTQRYAKSMICAVVEGVSRKLREKDVEVVNMKHRNRELEEKLKELTVESRAWQVRAQSNEAMVNLLRTNIEQTCRDHMSREGCGDSEEEAASWQILIDEVLERKCRICSEKEVSILLLPCLHLCLCKDCECEVQLCPICQSFKTAAVQVYFA